MTRQSESRCRIAFDLVVHSCTAISPEAGCAVAGTRVRTGRGCTARLLVEFGLGLLALVLAVLRFRAFLLQELFLVIMIALTMGDRHR